MASLTARLAPCLATARHWSGASLEGGHLASMGIPRGHTAWAYRVGMPRYGAGRLRGMRGVRGTGAPRVGQARAAARLEQGLLQHRHGGGVGLGEDADLCAGGRAGGRVSEESGEESGTGVVGRGGGREATRQGRGIGGTREAEPRLEELWAWCMCGRAACACVRGGALRHSACSGVKCVGPGCSAAAAAIRGRTATSGDLMAIAAAENLLHTCGGRRGPSRAEGVGRQSWSARSGGSGGGCGRGGGRPRAFAAEVGLARAGPSV